MDTTGWHHVGLGVAAPHQDLRHVPGLERTPLVQDFERVERRLDRRADRPFLDVGAGDLVALAKLLDQARRIGAGRIGQDEVVRSREHIVDAGPAGTHQQRGGQPAARRHAAEHERLLDVIGVALPGGDAGGLLRGVVKQPAHVLGVEPAAQPAAAAAPNTPAMLWVLLCKSRDRSGMPRHMVTRDPMS